MHLIEEKRKSNMKTKILQKFILNQIAVKDILNRTA